MYTLQRANNEKGEFSQLLPIWIRLRGFSAWGIQTGPFAACWANFVLKFLQLLSLILGAQCLWLSNWTTCSLLSQFCSEIFPTFDFHTWGSMSMAFKLDHLQPVEPILFWKIFNFFTFILGSPFLLPQRANYGSWESFPFPNMDETEGFQCFGHSNWTIFSPLSPFCTEIFPTFPLSYWGANSYYPRGLIMGVGRISLSQYG